MATKKELTKSQEQYGIVVSDERPDYLGDGARGNEGMTMSDLSIPRVEIVQALSPQRKKNDPSYIEGAEEGLLFNTVTGELYGSAITIIPVLYRKEYVIWRKRLKGGGFRGSFPTIEQANAALNAMEDREDCEVLDTGQHFALVVRPSGQVEEVVISMSKSKMKTSRQLNTMVKLAGGDRFSRAYQLATVMVKNDKGEFYNFGIKQLGFPTKELYERAESLYEAIRGEGRTINYENATGTDEVSDY